MIENFQNTKGRGQNFLIDDNIINKIVSNIPVGKIIEIGPGAGGITDKLLVGRELTLIEIDENLVTFLSKRYENEINNKKVTIINSDATKFDYTTFSDKNLTVVGNLPYSVANRIIRNIGKYSSIIDKTVFMTQKEPALKLAGKDTSGYGSLRAFINTFYDIKLLFDIPPTAFKPKPKIVSTLFSFTKKENSPDLNPQKASEYFDFTEYLYQKKGKTVVNNLQVFGKESVKELLNKMELKENIRPNELTPDEIFKLWENIKKQKKEI